MTRPSNWERLALDQRERAEKAEAKNAAIKQRINEVEKMLENQVIENAALREELACAYDSKGRSECKRLVAQGYGKTKVELIAGINALRFEVDRLTNQTKMLAWYEGRVKELETESEGWKAKYLERLDMHVKAKQEVRLLMAVAKAAEGLLCCFSVHDWDKGSAWGLMQVAITTARNGGIEI